jgi:hypothetical protein
MSDKESRNSKLDKEVRSKFDTIKNFAEKSGWLLIDECKEDDDNYPSLVYLTQIGKIINIEMDEDSVELSIEDEYSIDLDED